MSCFGARLFPTTMILLESRLEDGLHKEPLSRKQRKKMATSTVPALELFTMLLSELLKTLLNKAPAVIFNPSLVPTRPDPAVNCTQ